MIFINVVSSFLVKVKKNCAAFYIIYYAKLRAGATDAPEYLCSIK